MVEMLPKGRVGERNDGSCLELKGDFNRSWAGTVQNVDPQTRCPTGLPNWPHSREESKQQMVLTITSSNS